MQGFHIIADFKKINFLNKNFRKDIIKDFISKSITQVGLTELGSHYHTFGKENELTGVIALGESHITFHTWPEKDYISLDIFVCNLKDDNTKKAKELYLLLKNFFGAGEVKERFLDRN